MRSIIAIAAASAALIGAVPAFAQLPTSGVIAGSVSTAGSSSSTRSSHPGTATAGSLAGNASTGGAASSNGATTANPNLQVNTVDTYSSSVGGTANVSNTTGAGKARSSAHQGGFGGGAGISYVPSYSPH